MLHESNLCLCGNLRLCILKNDVEMPVPKYFVNERLKSLKEREKLMGQILARIGPQDKVQVKM